MKSGARVHNLKEESGEMKNIINNEVINQVSLLQGLTFGDYTGSVTVAELKKMGDIGIGTFDKLNGELIMLDGVVYRAAGDGSVEVVNDEETIPFADLVSLHAVMLENGWTA